MPNWCSQNLVVLGPKRQLKLLRDAVLCSEQKNFAHLYPCPKELAETRADLTEKPEMLAKYGYSDWYEWSLANWGSKWSDQETILMEDESEDYQQWYFQSAWSPMDGLIEKVSEKYDKLLFGLSYTEESGAFAGYAYIHKGKTLEVVSVPCDPPEDLKAWAEANDRYDSVYDWSNELEMTIYDDCLTGARKMLKQLRK